MSEDQPDLSRPDVSNDFVVLCRASFRELCTSLISGDLTGEAAAAAFKDAVETDGKRVSEIILRASDDDKTQGGGSSSYGGSEGRGRVRSKDTAQNASYSMRLITALSGGEGEGKPTVGKSQSACQTPPTDVQLMRQLFAEIDTDGSGYISKDELLALNDGNLHSQSFEQQEQVRSLVEEAMRTADQDGDGLLDYHEFLGMVTVHTRETRKNCIFFRFPFLTDTVLCVLFFLLSPVIFCNFNNDLEQWSVWDALYFSVVTLSTVGYGDRTPTNDGMKIFTIFYILFGLCAVAGCVENAIWIIIKYHERNARRARTAMATLAMSAFEKVGDVKRPIKLPPLPKPTSADSARIVESKAYKFFHSLIPHWGLRKLIHKVCHHDMVTTLLSSGLMFLIPALVGGLIISHIEDWSLLHGVYWSVVTCTTVGYGDLPLSKETSRIFAMCFILLSSISSGAAISNIGRQWLERRIHKLKQRMLSQSLSMELLKTLLHDDHGLDRCDFVCAMLVQLEMVQRDDLLPLLQKFDDMDLDKSGVLDLNDWEIARRRAVMSRQNGNSQAISSPSLPPKKPLSEVPALSATLDSCANKDLPENDGKVPHRKVETVVDIDLDDGIDTADWMARTKQRPAVKDG